MFKKILSYNPLVILSTTIIFYILRMVVPIGNYFFIPFFLFYLFFISYHILKNYKQINLAAIIKPNLFLILISTLFILGFIFSSKFIFLAFKEFLNLFIILFLSFCLFYSIRNKESLSEFAIIMGKQLILFSLIISILGLTKLILQVMGLERHFIKLPYQIIGSSLNSDYNFYCLFSIMGLLSFIIFRFKTKLVFNISFVTIILLNIFFSGSRRGIFILALFGLIIALFGFNLKYNLKKISYRILFMLLMFFMVIVSFCVLRNSNFIKIKNQSLDLIDNNTDHFSDISTQIIYRYLTIFNYKKSYSDLYERLWLYENLFDSKMNYDRFCDGINKDNLIYNGNFKYGLLFWDPMANVTRHEIINTNFGSGIRVSRDDGNGDWWSLFYNGRPIIYYAGHSYEYKFFFKVEKGGELPFWIGWWVNDGNQGYSSTANLPLEIKELPDGWKEATATYKFKETHYNLPTFLNSLQDSSIVDIADIRLVDLERNEFLPKFIDQISEPILIDNNMGVDTLASFHINNNKLYSPRLNRWIYSWVIFQDSLSFPEKIFGGGFGYLEMMGKEFDEVKYDDPHNPFLSAFLYSGILGGIAYIWFMFLVFYYYIRYFKYHIYFFVCFLMVFFFSFVSANTHFSIPIYSILCIIPFLTRHIVENEKRMSKPLELEII